MRRRGFTLVELLVVITIIGVLIVTTLNTGLSHLGVSSSWQRISIGIVIVFAVWLDFVQRRRETRA